MRLNWKLVWLAMLTGAALLSGGCGGINAGGTVSPASFLVPGLIKADPAAPVGTPFPAPAPAKELAQAR